MFHFHYLRVGTFSTFQSKVKTGFKIGSYLSRSISVLRVWSKKRRYGEINLDNVTFSSVSAAELPADRAASRDPEKIKPEN